MPGRDPFGFQSGRRVSQPSRSPPGRGRPLVVVAGPGQEIRVVVPSGSENTAGLPGDSRASPQPSTDSRVSPSPPGDVAAPDPFGFKTPVEPSYSPRPVTIVAQPGQEIHVIVPGESGLPGGLPGDSRASPQPSPDRRARGKSRG
jgi:hypothetical protein